MPFLIVLGFVGSVLLGSSLLFQSVSERVQVRE
jgi:hypothetical protein